MADQSASANPILCASFNQDNSYFAIGTKNGFKVFDSATGRLCYGRDIGAYSIVEMLFASSLLAIVGAGEQPSLSPRRLCLYNTAKGDSLRELNFLTSILAIRLNKQKLVVVLQEKTYIYDMTNLCILDAIETVSNPKGLCAFSPSLDGCFLALPASITKGSALVYNVNSLQTHCEIDAHRSPLSAIALSSNGTYLATASEHGTIVRVHLVSEATKAYSFRRGTYPSNIFSLSFSPSLELPDLLGVTSSSGSLHIFGLESSITQRNRRLNSFLSSLIPNSVKDALDPHNHYVFHNAYQVGVKSCIVIRKVDKISETTTAPESAACKAKISIVSYNGYFMEYSLIINHENESSWSLKREINLLTAVAANPPTIS